MKSDIRRAGINPNHWYAVAQSSEVSKQNILGVRLWGQPMAIFRDTSEQLQCLEDRCPHRNVQLSHGRLVGSSLECAYHGWRVDSSGACVAIPYLEENQKLPTCRIRSFPVREQQGLIWVFPGDPDLAGHVPCLEMPEWDDLNYVASVAEIDTQAHFSFLIENLIDMYHGHLHAQYQAWSNAHLIEIKQSDERLEVCYEAITHMRVQSIFSPRPTFAATTAQSPPCRSDCSLSLSPLVFKPWQRLSSLLHALPDQRHSHQGISDPFHFAAFIQLPEYGAYTCKEVDEESILQFGENPAGSIDRAGCADDRRRTACL